jgi:sugar O-acyltransferase (sialic acid O-acetyltransferase NeuD family)
MATWVLFGFGNYISDIFDIIHAHHDTVKAVVKNFEPTKEQLDDIKRRIALIGYEIPIIDLDMFDPAPGEHYMYGFHTGREKVIRSLEDTYSIKFSNLIHPTAHVGSNVGLGRGICIGPHTVIAPNVRIENFSSINRSCSIGHDTEIGEYVTINPGVSIAGLVKVGERTTIGIGAVVIDKIRVGSDSIIGAGAVVIRDVPDHVVSAGVPAKTIREIQ